MTPQAPSSAQVDRSGIAAAATVISLGNVTSRVLGLIREVTITHLFGATAAVSAFRAAASTYNLFYELLVGGLIPSALVPVMSEYAAEDQNELRRLLGAITLTLAGVTTFIVLTLELAAPALAWMVGGGFGGQLRSLTTTLIQISLPAVLLMSLAGLFSAALYSSRRFTYPAFMAATFNLAIIVCAFLLANRLGVAALAIGVVVGAAMQLLLQSIGLWRNDIGPLWCVVHPALRQLIRLALPVLVSLAVGQAQVMLDRNLASRTGDQSIAWMANATTLIQFPLGLVAAAVSLAALPDLSRLAATEDLRESFVATLAFSLRLVLVLILPTTAALLVLGEPIIRLLFEHGQFTPTDTDATASALRLYLLGLPFAAIDQSLISAFYAQRDTLRPAVVGVVSVGTYLAVALVTMRPWGMIGLVAANSAQWLVHAAIMLKLTCKHLGHLKGHGILQATTQAALASGAAAIAMRTGILLLEARLGPSLLAEITLVAIPVAFGVLTYLVVMILLDNRDLAAILKLASSFVRELARAR